MVAVVHPNFHHFGINLMLAFVGLIVAVLVVRFGLQSDDDCCLRQAKCHGQDSEMARQPAVLVALLGIYV